MNEPDAEHKQPNNPEIEKDIKSVSLDQDPTEQQKSKNVNTVSELPIIETKTLSNVRSHTHNSSFKDLRDIALYCEQQGALILASDIRNHVELIHLEAPHLDVHLVNDPPKDLPGKITQFLNSNTTEKWIVAVSDSRGSPTIQETDETARRERFSVASEHPVAKQVLETFHGSKVIDVITPNQPENLSSSSSLATSDLTENTESDVLHEHSTEKEKMYDA